MILSFINIRKVPREMLKTSGFALRFQRLPRDIANVNEWKIMFDPYINKSAVYCLNKLSCTGWLVGPSLNALFLKYFLQWARFVWSCADHLLVEMLRVFSGLLSF